MSGIDHVGLFVRSLDNLLKNTKDRHAHLRAACNFVKPRIEGKNNSEEGTVPLSEQEKANLCFYPLKLACETREPLLVSPAIGCLEKLLAHGFCTLEMIYEPPAVPEPQEKKGFFSGGSSSPPPANKDAPKPGVSPRAVAENSDLLIGQIVATVCNVVSTNSEELQLQTIRVLLTAVSTPACALHGPYLLAAIRTIYNIFLSAASQGPANPTQTTAKASLSQIVGIVLSRLESEQQEQASEGTSSPPRSEPASPVAHHSRNVSNLTLSDVDEEDAGGSGSSTVFASPSEKDCFLILNSLCSLSQKSDDVVAVWSVEMQSKILSLSLLQSMLSSGGNLFMTRPVFSELIRNRFWKALLNACASATAEVARTAMRLFSHIVLNFRAHLKAEIGTFFYKVIFPLLETQSTSFAQKHIILTTLMGICSDSQVVCDLFVNYDCAIGCKPLYENLIYRVAKVIQTTWTAPNWVTQEEENDLKLEALNVLTQITRGINSWYERKQKSQSAPASPEAAATSSSTTGGAEGVSFTAEENKAFENLRKNKKEYEAVVMAFNEKAKNGIKLGLERGLIKEDTPAEIAAFFETPGLNKVIIGDYLAEVKNKDVLVCFIHRNDFKDLMIDEAMRLFLGKFKIKGEAQVVDRTMEIFTEIYCAQNPEAFSSASAAFILSFAIMMLNTDAHNPNIKPENKMQLNSFLRTVAGIDDGKDLPRQFCEDIYRRITTREIKLQGDSNVPNAQANPAAKPGEKDENKAPDGIFLSQRKRKEMQQRMESHNIAKSSMEVDGATWGQLEYIAAASSDVVVAMWECSWISTLAAYSYPLEEREEQQLVDVCLRGFTDAVRLCCNVNADSEREAFLANLAKFTHLTSTREMEPKNIKSLMTLLTIASREAEYLGSSWYEVLKCISLLDKLHMVSNSRDLGASSSSANARVAERSAELRRVEQHNAELVTNSMDMGAVEKLFANSAELGGPAVVHLVEALCRLSAEELGEAKLRTYSLQKLVEVAEQNVSRLRFEWSQMWHHLSAHFISAGLSKNRNVSMFAVDSLRQLAMKFLGRDELGNFNFQRDFLKPFDVIATQTRQTEIRELIAASIEQMTRSRAKNIMSGWKVILSTLSRLARDVHTNVVTLGFQVLDYLVLHCTHYFTTKDLFVEMCATLSRFADNVCSTDVSLKCVHYIRASAKFLVTGMPSASHALFADSNAGQQTPTRNSVDGEDGGADNLNGTIKQRAFDDLLLAEGDQNAVFLQGSADSPIDMHLWLSVCAGLSSLVNVAVDNIAVEAIDGLFGILTNYGHLFDAEQWHLVVGGTVHPIVENTLVNVSLITRDDPAQDQSLNRAAIVVKRTLELYTQLLRKFPVVLAERVQIEAISSVLNCYHAQHGRLVTIGDNFLRAVLAPAPGQEILVKGLNDEEYLALQENLATWVTSYHQQTDGEQPRLQTLSTVAQVCTDILGYGLATKRMSNSTAHTFLDIIERSLSFVQLRLDCAVSLTDGGATLEAAEVTVLLAVEMDSFEGLFRALAIMEDETLYASWISKVLLRHKNALESPRSSDPTQNESNVLAQVSGGLLENMLGMPDAFFLLVATVAYEVLCEAIRSCNPVICEPLASVLLRYGRLHQSGTETLPAARQQPSSSSQGKEASAPSVEENSTASPNISGEPTPVVSAPPQPQSKKGGKKGGKNKNKQHHDPVNSVENAPVTTAVEPSASDSPKLETSGGDGSPSETEVGGASSGFKWGSGEDTTITGVDEEGTSTSGFKWGETENTPSQEHKPEAAQWGSGGGWGAAESEENKESQPEDDL